MQFRLREPHIIEGAWRPAGTIVGPWGSGAPVVLNTDPTPGMEGVDDEGKAKVNEIFNRLHGTDAPWHMGPVGPGQPAVPGQIVADEKPYEGDHPDNQEVDQEAQDKANQELVENSQRFHSPLPPQNISGAQGTFVRPMTPETPQDQAIRPDRPLGQTLPDAMPSVAGTSPNAEAAKKEATERKAPEPPKRSFNPPKVDKDEE